MLSVHCPYLCLLMILGVDRFRPDDLTLIQGKWEAVCVRYDGTVNKEAVGTTFTFSGKKLSIGNKDVENVDAGIIVAEFTISSSKRPKELTWTGEFRGDRFVVRAIYEVEGDTLKYCALMELPIAVKEKPRPTEFKTVAGDERTLAVLKRVREPAKK